MMHRTIFLRFFTCSLLMLAGYALVAQQVYYVSPAGDDAAGGQSLASSWRTIAHGLATIAPGDTLLVADGLYVETDLKIRQKSTAGRPTVIKSINPWGAKIEGTTQYATILQTDSARHVVIDGFEVFNNENRPFQDWNTGINIYRSNFVVVQNCYVHDCGCGGIGGRESDYMTIRRNVTRGNAKTNPYNCSGISIYQPTQLDDEPGTHILIAENVCFENECRLPFSPLGFTTPTDGNGIILDDFNWTQSLGDGPQQQPFVAETIIENNLTFNNGGAGMKAYEVANAIFRNNTSVHNNYVLEEYGSNIAEIAGQAVGGDVAFYNNVAVQAFGQRGYAMYWEPIGSEATLDVKNNLIVGDILWRRPPTLANNQTTNYDEQSYPRFAQIVPDDFTFNSVDDFRQFFGLREGSPAIGAGDASLAPATDLNGNPRPSSGAIDLGAFQGAVAGVGPLAPDQVFEQEIPSTSFPVSVDGVKDPVYSAKPVAIERLTFGRISNATDLSATWTACWDETNLYLFVDVTDSRLHNDSPDPSQDDGVEIFIDGDNSRGDSYDGVNDFHFVLGWNDTQVVERSRNAVAGIVVAQGSSFTGYTKEIAIPWVTLGMTPTDELLFGLDFWVNDDDNDGPVDGRLTWQGRLNDAPTKPAAFGSGRLFSAAPPPPVSAVGPAGVPVVDGQLDQAWWGTTAHPLTNLLDGTVTDEDDLSATWRAMWNPTFLFLYVSVTDDALRSNSSDWFNDDAVEIYLDMGLERSETYDANDRQLYVRYGSNNVVAEQGTLGQGVFATVADTEKGYDVELRLPWSALGFIPAEGKFFGFDVHLTDDDDNSARDGKLAWFTTLDESFENPSLFGSVYLGQQVTTATVDPVQALPFGVYPNPATGVVTLDLPRLPDSVSVVDLFGREVLRAENTRRLDLSQLPAASYLITAKAGARTYRTAVIVNR